MIRGMGFRIVGFCTSIQTLNPKSCENKGSQDTGLGMLLGGSWVVTSGLYVG